jgi:hypothetical protein
MVALRFSADPASGSAADAYPHPRLAGPAARLAEGHMPDIRHLLDFEQARLFALGSLGSFGARFVVW